MAVGCGWPVVAVGSPVAVGFAVAVGLAVGRAVVGAVLGRCVAGVDGRVVLIGFDVGREWLAVGRGVLVPGAWLGAVAAEDAVGRGAAVVAGTLAGAVLSPSGAGAELLAAPAVDGTALAEGEADGLVGCVLSSDAAVVCSCCGASDVPPGVALAMVLGVALLVSRSGAGMDTLVEDDGDGDGWVAG